MPTQADCPAGTTWDGAKCTATAPSASASASAPTPSASAAALGMVRIPAGDFQMGTNDIDNPIVKPVHQVHVDSFEMDAKEVTVGDYAACVAAKSCTPANTGLYCNGDKKDHADHPTNCVDFERAAAYCKSAGKRLPTETSSTRPTPAPSSACWAS